MSTNDIEELLDPEIVDYVRKFLIVIRDIIWNC